MYTDNNTRLKYATARLASLGHKPGGLLTTEQLAEVLCATPDQLIAARVAGINEFHFVRQPHRIMYYVDSVLDYLARKTTTDCWVI